MTLAELEYSVADIFKRQTSSSVLGERLFHYSKLDQFIAIMENDKGDLVDLYVLSTEQFHSFRTTH